MGLQPNIARKRSFALKQCAKCGASQTPDAFAPTKSVFYNDGSLPICNSCVEDYLDQHDFDWKYVNKLCQWADIPFVPREWERLFEMNGSKAFGVYAEVFAQSEYEDLGWEDYFQAFKDLKASGDIEDELPGIADQKRKQLQERWGANYDDEALRYLENLYSGLITTQNVNGALQIDQAIKICKMSYEIDNRIREGSDFDKLLASYDKLVKAAEFTPKNVKNINDFDSVGELIKWLEKRGWKNTFFDGVTRDIVDETIKNFQNFNQRLYTNESGIGEQITERINALRTAKQIEDETYYGTSKEYDLDNYDNEGYARLVKDEEFSVNLDEEDDDI